MSKNKAKKTINFFKDYSGLPGMSEEIKRRERKYQKHRNKSSKKK